MGRVPPSSFLLSRHFPRVLNAKTPFRGPIFRSARTGTLAMQEIGYATSTGTLEKFSDELFGFQHKKLSFTS